jgi:phosphate transport system permease protein
VSSLSEDALRAVPVHLKEASFAMGATKFQTIFRVMIPAAFSGIVSALILGVSRALGETMVVSIAAGMQPHFTLNVFEPAQTITAYIVQVSLGDIPHDSMGYQTIYVAGLTLFCLTMIFNLFGIFLKKRYQEVEVK